MTTRISNWPEMLAAFVEERRSMPFSWRTQNCGFFACDWIRIMVGVDPAGPFRGMGRAVEIVRAIRAAGGVGVIADEAAKMHEWNSVPAASIQRGDIAEADTKSGPALGVCLGRQSAFVGKSGLQFILTARCTRGWRIG